MISLINLLKNIAQSNLNTLKYPYKLTFATTYKCNSRCSTCNIWQKKSLRKEMELKEIEKFFKENSYFSTVDLTGGEIFLRKDIVNIAEAIIHNCKNLYLLHFPTNGLMPKIIQKRTEEIIALRPNKLIITVSLDGPKELYVKIRGIDGWKSAIDTFRLLRKIEGLEVYFGMTLSVYNYDKIEDTISSVRQVIPDIKYDDFHINIAHISQQYYGNEKKKIGAPKEELLHSLYVFNKRKKRQISAIGYIEQIYQKNIKNYLKTGITPYPCKAARASCFMNPYGDIFACSMDNLLMGNIKNEKFKDIWTSANAKIIRAKIQKKQCAQCWTPCEAYQSILGNILHMPG